MPRGGKGGTFYPRKALTHVPANVVTRLVDNVHLDGSCVIPNRVPNANGYIPIAWIEEGERVATLAHRVAWWAKNGDIPQDLTVDHVCRDTRCINPDHMRLIPQPQNASENGWRLRSSCSNGHPYEEGSFVVYGDNCRRCLICRSKYRAVSRARAKAKRS